NDLNLCDITRHFVPSSPPCQELILNLTSDDLAAADALLAEHGVDPGQHMVVCMQLGASERIKRWSEERFAELARLLRARYDARIFLVGVSSEAPLGEAFARMAPDTAVPLFGKTSLPQLAALLSRSRFLVTNDTGTMHIAAAVKCPVALVSVGPVHYRETGPFGEGHCAVEWRRPWAGRSDISRAWEEERSLLQPPQVARAIELLLSGAQNFTPDRQIPEDQELAQVDIHVTRFAPDGCLEYYPAIRRPMSELDFLRVAYRAMWLDYFSEGGMSPSREEEALRAFVSFYEVPGPEELGRWFQTHRQSFQEMADLASRGRALSERLIAHLERRGSMIEARNMVRELTRLDESIRVFSEVHHGCRPLVTMARFERDNLEGMDPLPLARSTRDIYGAMVERCILMGDKINRLSALLNPDKSA
ncbi:MAG TPA: glycosyltransferase family 9 protein, partial [Candidatus Hydrogenedentes bacterium]|nr:glycosyltransferase family 9 protein [Candidatus Hydrogenedentota bacterium]